jgi:hypothetical protein
MRERRMKGAAIGKTILDRNVVPAEYLERIQVVDNRECVKLMQAWDYASILDVRQAANMKNQLRTATARR